MGTQWKNFVIVLASFLATTICHADSKKLTPSRPNFFAIQFIGLGIAREQLKFGYGLSPNSDLQLEIGRMYYNSPGHDERNESYSIHYRRFVYLELYFKAGLDFYVTHFDGKNYPYSIDKTYGYSADVSSFTVLFGGQFHWKKLVFGGELIGINQPIKHQITSEYANSTYPDSREDLEDMKRYLNRTWFEAIRAYVGFEF